MEFIAAAGIGRFGGDGLNRCRHEQVGFVGGDFQMPAHEAGIGPRTDGDDETGRPGGLQGLTQKKNGALRLARLDAEVVRRSIFRFQKRLQHLHRKGACECRSAQAQRRLLASGERGGFDMIDAEVGFFADDFPHQPDGGDPIRLRSAGGFEVPKVVTDLDAHFHGSCIDLAGETRACHREEAEPFPAHGVGLDPLRPGVKAGH